MSFIIPAPPVPFAATVPDWPQEKVAPPGAVQFPPSFVVKFSV
jgi:hypothetical protein